MKHIKKNKEYGILIFIVLFVILFACGCGEMKKAKREKPAQAEQIPPEQAEQIIPEQIEKGYGLPIEEEAGKQAEEDCKKVMNMLLPIYQSADKGNALNAVISDEVMFQMKKVIGKTGCPVTSSEAYATMENHEKMEAFLHDCEKGKEGSVVLYQVYSHGGIGRMEYLFTGGNLYLLQADAVWNAENQPEITCLSYTRVREWNYTEKGWFCCQLCVPEYPYVTEVVDGSRMIRVKPLAERYRRLSKQCVFPLGYQGNNLLCSNWDIKTMENLDYNGMYEYLYAMKYKERFPGDAYPAGIPAEQFENVIMEYLPVTREQIREWAVFDSQNETYAWESLGCMNYAPALFGTSLPEVVAEKKNADGTVTLTVDAVSGMLICNDAVITHELTVCFTGENDFQYLGNQILQKGIQDIPEYQYRFS